MAEKKRAERAESVGGKKTAGKPGEKKPVPRVLDPKLRQEFEQIAAAAGCELVHAEIKGGTLRLILDKDGGVNLSDCEYVSKQVSAFLDVVDFGKSRYVLEVSSPGLDRQLYQPRDYERFAGRLARVTLEEGGTRKTVVARLQELRRPDGRPEEEGEVVLLDEKSGESWAVPLKNIRLARLEVEL
jgi:ribosome maturation factor RimP